MGPLRPTSVNVMSVIGFVWGGIAVLAAYVTLLALIAGGKDPAGAALMAKPGYVPLAALGGVASLGLNGLLMVASVEALRLKPWARKALLWYAVLALVLLSYSTIFAMIYVMPVAQREMMQQFQMPAGQEGLFVTLTKFGTMCGVVLKAALPAALMIVYNRRVVTEAFGVKAAGPAAG